MLTLLQAILDNKMNSTPPKSKIILLASCITVILCILFVSLIGFALWWANRESINFNTAKQVTLEFVENIHYGNIETAYSMLSEKFAPPITMEQFSELIQQDQAIFNTYEQLDICEWGVFYHNGYIIDTNGLLYYKGGAIFVQISLHKDSDAVWRIQGFKFSSDIEPVPFGLCK